MIWNRVVVAVVALLVAIVAIDALRGSEDESRAIDGYRIDLASARDGTWLPVSLLREMFPGPTPRSLAVAHVAVAPDETVAVAVTHARDAGIELWDGDTFVGGFSVPAGSFLHGIWFTRDGRVIAMLGADGRGRLYTRNGRLIEGTAYFSFDSRR